MHNYYPPDLLADYKYNKIAFHAFNHTEDL
jgi:hypothetical protein